jgi:hypothetical protein
LLSKLSQVSGKQMLNLRTTGKVYIELAREDGEALDYFLSLVVHDDLSGEKSPEQLK